MPIGTGDHSEWDQLAPRFQLEEAYRTEVTTMPGYRPHPFHWVPADGRRHASTDEHPPGASIYPDGTETSTLCQRTVKADTSDTAWLWETCLDCNSAAHELAGLPPLAGAR